MESTGVEVLILNGLEEGSFYKLVTYGGRKILVEFERPRGGDA
jgi:hypothetical protein